MRRQVSKRATRVQKNENRKEREGRREAGEARCLGGWRLKDGDGCRHGWCWWCGLAAGTSGGGLLCGLMGGRGWGERGAWERYEAPPGTVQGPWEGTLWGKMNDGMGCDGGSMAQASALLGSPEMPDSGPGLA